MGSTRYIMSIGELTRKDNSLCFFDKKSIIVFVSERIKAGVGIAVDTKSRNQIEYVEFMNKVRCESILKGFTFCILYSNAE